MKTNGQYFIQNERNLLKFFAAKNPITVLYFIVPYISLAVHLALKYTYSLNEIIAYFLLSLLYWSFVEYLIHRYFFHLKSRYKTLNYLVGSFHIYHHKNPDDLSVINSGWITAFFGLFLHGSIFYLLSFDMKTVYALLIGTLLVYYYYEWVHYLVHQKIYTKGLLKYYQDFHLTHHIKPKKNFGQITPIWDYIFQTKTENLETKNNKRMLQFIKVAQND